MSLELLNAGLDQEVTTLASEGRAKAPERVIVDHIPASGDRDRGTGWRGATSTSFG